MPQERLNHQEGPTAEAVFAYLELPRLGRELKGMLSRSLRGGVEQGFSVYYNWTLKKLGIHLDRDVSPYMTISDLHNWAWERDEKVERVARFHVHPAEDDLCFVPSRPDLGGIQTATGLQSIHIIFINTQRHEVPVWLWQSPKSKSDLNRVLSAYDVWRQSTQRLRLTWSGVEELEKLLKESGLHVVRTDLARKGLQDIY